MPGEYMLGKYPQVAGAGVFEYTVPLVAATTTAAGGVASVANPLGVPLIIVDCILNITTAATTATNLVNVGVAADGTTSSVTLLDGKAAAAGIFSSRAEGGTGGKTPRTWSATQFVTATASATLVGMVGTLTLLCVRQ